MSTAYIAEKIVIRVYVRALREPVPFAYALFGNQPHGFTLLGQRTMPSKILGLGDMVGSASDRLVLSLAEIAEEEKCDTVAEIRHSIYQALMPQSSAFSVDEMGMVSGSNITDLTGPTQREITAALNGAKAKLNLVRQISHGPYWLHKRLEGDRLAATP